LSAWLIVLFFLSGISGLAYQVVWVRMLTRVLGCTVYATSTVLAAFMAGLALGSYGAGRWIDRSVRPLAWYVCLEVGVGVAALVSLALPDRLVPIYHWFFALAGGSRGWLTLGQVSVAWAVLVIPTALMGATLPALCTALARERGAVAPNLARLYAANTLGGVVGVLAAGFVLLGALGETGTMLAGVALNLAVGLGGWSLLRRHRAARSAVATPAASGPASAIPGAGGLSIDHPMSVRRAVLLCYAANGFVALATEVIWGRMLVLYQGTSVYAFSAMLAVVLAAIGLGSLWAGSWVDRLKDPLGWLARLHLATALAIGLALHLFDQLGYLPRPDLANRQGLNLMTMVAAPIVLLGPMGMVWGAIFPVSARCYASNQLAGRSVADLYAWNTLGCIAGSLVAGFLLIPHLGSTWSAVGLAAVSLAAGLGLAWLRRSRPERRGAPLDWGLAALAVVLIATVDDPYYAVLRQRMQAAYPQGMKLFRHVEDVAGTTTAFGAEVGGAEAKELWVNGQGMTYLVTASKLMAHLPIWLADNPRDVLVVCFGMGTTVRSALRYPNLQVTAVELVPGVVKCFGYYHADGPKLLRSPSLNVLADDGRNYLLMHRQAFDVITVDPAPPLYSAGTVNLYSREFFELCRQRMRPGGVVCVWVAPGPWSEVKMLLRTFHDVFEHTTVWGGPDYPGFYLCGSDRPKVVQPKVYDAILRAYSNAQIAADLTEWMDFLRRPESVLYLYVCNGRQLRPFLSDTRAVTDDRPYIEFPLWRAFRDKDYARQLDALVLKEAVGIRAREPVP
jgi:spermidine synthase